MKLTDTQAIILGKAAEHAAGLCALPAIPPAPRAQIARKLAFGGLVEEIVLDSSDAATAGFIWRTEDAEAFGLRITTAGLEAICIDPSEWPAHCRPETAPAGEPEAVAIADLTPATHPIAAANAASWPAGPAKGGRRKAAEEAAARGELPAPPDFSADTHKPYRAKLAKAVAMAEAGDVAGLRAMVINPTSTSPKALARYRDLAVIALEARAPR
jgi:hypothetical protein